MRRIVIGDIHGCSKALRTLLEIIDPQRDDELVFLGDYVDRGPDSRDVIQQILEVCEKCKVIALRGNHEVMLLGVCQGGISDESWLANGGRATVTSYGGSLDKIPESHLAFFRQLKPYYETDDSIFVHAGYNPSVPMHEQESMWLYWNHLPSPPPPPHVSGKRVFVGHTPQPFGAILNGGHVVGIDTYCFGGGFLTAFDVGSNELIQTDIHGFVRRAPGQLFVERLNRIKDRIRGLVRSKTVGEAKTLTNPHNTGIKTRPADESG